MAGDAFDESGRHVDADFVDSARIAFMDLQIFSKGCHGGRILASSDEYDLALFHVDKQRNVVMAATSSGFINADLSNLGMIGFAARQIHIMVDDPPQ